MLPHPKGEARDIADAFAEISLGLKGVKPNDITDADPLLWLERIRKAMDYSGLVDPYGDGLFWVKAKKMRRSKKYEFAEAVSELEYWLDQECR